MARRLDGIAAAPAVVAVVAPVLVGGIVALVLRSRVGGTHVYVEGSAAETALLIGAVVAVVVAVALAGAAIGRRGALPGAEVEPAVDDLATGGPPPGDEWGSEVRTVPVPLVGDRAVDAAAAAAREEHRRFLLRLDHELKNPMTALRAGLANLESMVAADAESAAVLRSVDAQVARLAGLTGDLRKVAELAAQAMALEPVELPPLLAEAAREIEAVTGRHVEVQVAQAPIPVPRVAADEDLLFVVLQNLLANAARYTGSGDSIELRARSEPPWVVVEVADSGPGIAPDDLDVVWEELGRGRNALGTPGTGLGLALVRTIVARHGGRAELRSEVGRGSVVTISLVPAPSTSTEQLPLLAPGAGFEPAT